MTVFNKNNVDFKKAKPFFGEPLNTQRFDEFKYPIFDKLTQTQLGFFWRPEEVSLQKDRNDYAQLSKEQKHIFTSNLLNVQASIIFVTALKISSFFSDSLAIINIFSSFTVN